MGPLLSCNINVFAISNANAIMGLDFRAKESVSIDSINMDMPDSILNLETQLPISISNSEACSILYSVRLLDCSELDQRKSLSFSVVFSRQGRDSMNTHFCARLPTQDGSLLSKQQPANHGRLFESATKAEPKEFRGIEVSLAVLPPVHLHTVFSVKVLVANTGEKIRNFTVEIPSISLQQKENSRTGIPNLAMTPAGKLVLRRFCK
jgi:hypothetical protein